MAFSADEILKKAKQQTEEKRLLAEEEEKQQEEKRIQMAREELNQLQNEMKSCLDKLPDDKKYMYVTLPKVTGILKHANKIIQVSGKYEMLEEYNTFLRTKEELQNKVPVLQKRQKMLEEKPALNKTSLICAVLEVLVIILIIAGTYASSDSLDGWIVGGLALIGAILGFCIGGGAGALGGLFGLGLIGLGLKYIIVSFIGRIILFIVWTAAVIIYFIIKRKKILE